LARTGGTPRPGTFGELLIDCEEDRVLRAVLAGMLREAAREPPGQIIAVGRRRRANGMGKKKLMVTLDADDQVITLSDPRGGDIVTIKVRRGEVTVNATSKLVIDAPQIEFIAGATHPAVFGDDLVQYLNQAILVFNTHMHPGETAGSASVTPAPPSPPLPVPTAGMLSPAVKTG
jgi:hypothetical protein